jgi:N-acetylglucosaminyl-diphospho-decaprenol L-rhamnosyltransferase
MSNLPSVSILIVSYNTRELTLACLRSVYAQTQQVPYEVIVVDNTSSDGSADAIAAEFPRAQLIRLDENIGFARANNVAARHATGDYLLLLNPDTVVLDGAVQKVVAFAAARGDNEIVGGRTFFGDGTLNSTSCHGRPTPWSMMCQAVGLTAVFRGSDFFNPEALGSWPRDCVREVDAVTGCFLLISRRLWEQLGGFDEAFFMYGEETDLCLRAKPLGAKCVICPEATLVHYGGQSEKVRSDKMVKLFKAKVQLARRHWRPGTAWFATAMLRLWALTRLVAFRAASAGNNAHRTGYETWRDVWRRRTEYGHIGIRAERS